MSQNFPRPEQPLVILLLLEGKITTHEDRRFETLVSELVDKGSARFVFDFNMVDFIDSAGIGLIMKIAARIKNAAGEVVLCNPRTNVKNVFIMLGIDTRFQIFDRLGEALEHFGNLLDLEIIKVSM